MDGMEHAGRMSRRQFLGRGAVLALSLGLLRIEAASAAATTSAATAATEAAAPVYAS